MPYLYSTIDSPLGLLKLVASEQGLAAILWGEDKLQQFTLAKQNKSDSCSYLKTAAKQLAEYFAHKRKQFDLALDIQGTHFQQQVWQALLWIPYGKTAAYLDIAKHIGRPSASRAVGMAISKNPLSIIIPCHRIIASNGRLTGFRGGLQKKAFLLNFEK